MPFLAASVSLYPPPPPPPLFRKGTADEGAVKYVLEGHTYAKVRRHIPLEAMRGLRAAGALGGAGPWGGATASSAGYCLPEGSHLWLAYRPIPFLCRCRRGRRNQNHIPRRALEGHSQERSCSPVRLCRYCHAGPGVARYAPVCTRRANRSSSPVKLTPPADLKAATSELLKRLGSEGRVADDVLGWAPDDWAPVLLETYVDQ